MGIKGHHEIGDLYHGVLEGVLFQPLSMLQGINSIVTGEPNEIQYQVA